MDAQQQHGAMIVLTQGASLDQKAPIETDDIRTTRNKTKPDVERPQQISREQGERIPADRDPDDPASP